MKNQLFISVLALFVLFEVAKCAEYRVVVPVCDLRKAPQSAQVNYGYDALQLTQLIYNEVRHDLIINNNSKLRIYIGCRIYQ